MELAYNDGTIHGEPVYIEQFGVIYDEHDISRLLNIPSAVQNSRPWDLSERSRDFVHTVMQERAFDYDGSGVAGHFWFRTVEGRSKFIEAIEKTRIFNILKNTE
jgi:hypothetical protein